MSAPSLTEFLLARIAEDEHYGTHDRRLAQRWDVECEAKRQIVEIAKVGVEAISEGRPHRSLLSGRVHDCARILAHLALPFADHPDYREEWRP